MNKEPSVLVSAFAYGRMDGLIKHFSTTVLGHFMDRPSVVIYWNNLDINMFEIIDNKIVLRISIWILC